MVAYMKGQQRIAIFTGAYNHIADGVSLTLNRLVRYLLEQGTDVRIFAPGVSTPPFSGYGTVIPAPSVALPRRADYRLSLGLDHLSRKALKSFAPTVIHVATPDILGYQALMWAKAAGTPILATFHTHFASYLKHYGLAATEPLVWHYLRHFYNSCDLVLVPSTGIQRLLVTKGVTSRLELWQRGVDMSRFNPSQRSSSYRRMLGPQDTPVVLFTGRLVKEKGLHIFAEVISRLRKEGVAHRSLVVGDGPLRAQLERTMPYTIFAGHLQGHSLAQAYASSDLFFFPSASETFGNVVLEASASGLPTVAVKSEAFENLIEHGKNGFLSSASDLNALTYFVRLLLLRPEQRKQMGQQANIDAAAFRWPTVLSQMQSFYQTLPVLRASCPLQLMEA